VADTNPTARDWLLNYAGDSDWRTQVDRLLDQHRAEVLSEAAVIALNLRQFEKAFGARAGAQISENVGIIRVADELLRLADGGESRG